MKTKYNRLTTVNREYCHEIYLYPKNLNKSDAHTIIIYISKDKNELIKWTVKGNDGTVTNVYIHKTQFNPNIPETRFKFDKSKFPGYLITE